MTERAPIRDCGPEFGRRLSRTLMRDLYRLGREADRWTIAEKIQSACDQFKAAEDEETRRCDARISNLAAAVFAVVAFPALAFAITCQLL